MSDWLHAHARRTSYLLMACLTLILGACSSMQPRNPMATWVPSDNFGNRHPQLIVLHYTEQDSVAESLDTLRSRNSGGPVSAHYLIGRDGRIYQLVSDAKRAWHAGGGRWGTITDVNSASLGIEIDNNGVVPFPPVQIDSLIHLLTDLTTRWHIPCAQIIGHQDLAPSRKPDPGPLFPWARLAAAGFGLWPDPAAERADPPPGFDPWMALTAVGYSLDDPQATVRAFHNHFRGMGGETLDDEDARILYNLVGKIERGDTEKSCPQQPPT